MPLTSGPSILYSSASPEQTQRLAIAFAENRYFSQIPVLLFYGDLGTGKTTFTRFLVQALPGGGSAEVSSPSFTLCNQYETKPPIWHFDLYRLENGMPPEELYEVLDYGQGPAIVEWAERLLPHQVSDDGVLCRLSRDHEKRTLRVSALGPVGEKFLQTLQRMEGLEQLRPATSD